jgi:hypothetical protein
MFHDTRTPRLIWLGLGLLCVPVLYVAVAWATTAVAGDPAPYRSQCHWSRPKYCTAVVVDTCCSGCLLRPGHVVVG